MKEAFYGSLCYEGLRGGAILVNDQAVVYKNQTITLPDEYKNIVIPFKDIEKVEKGQAGLFPAVTIHLKEQKKYKLVVFNRKKFLACLRQAGVM